MSEAKRTVRIGTRGSQLALAQAGEIKTALEAVHPNLEVQLVTIKTSGDQSQQVPPGETAIKEPMAPFKGAVGPLKGLFVKEIEEALIEGRIELAIHSAKDMETNLPDGLKLAAVPARQDPRDALVSRNGATLKELPAGSKVGVSCARRVAQLKRLRRDLELVPIRGNVDTRLKKLEEGRFDAVVLAACGLIRLGLQSKVNETLEPDQFLPAPGQGALGIEIRQDRQDLAELLKPLDASDSHDEVRAERALLKALGGSCQVPIGALGRVKEGSLTLSAVVLSPDGLKAIRKEMTGPKQAAEKLGIELASHLRAAGADRLLYSAWTTKGSL